LLTGVIQTGADTLAKDVPLELGEYGEQPGHGAACGRGQIQRFRQGNETDSEMLKFCVLSAMLRSGVAGEKVLLEEVALRDPVMPVSDGFIGGFIRIEGV
jgi:hypothetical protein